MIDDMNAVIITIIYTIMIAALGLVMGVGVKVEDVNIKCHQQAIEHHAAQFNATTGAFEWLK